VVTKYEILVTKYEILVTKYEIVVTKYEIVVTKYEILVTKYEILVTKYEIMVTKYEIVVAKYEILVTKYETMVTKYEIVVTKYEIMVTKYELMVTKYEIMVTKYKIMVTKYEILYYFYIHVTVHHNKFLFNKTNRRTNSKIYFYVKKFYMFPAVPLPIIRSFPLYIQHCYMPCRFDDSFQGRPSWSCLNAVITHAWHIPVPNVQWKTPDDGQRNCPKHVEFL